MASWSNKSESSTTFTNRQLVAGNLPTWNEATMTWDESPPSTWDVTRSVYNNRSKSSTSFTNKTKN